MLFEWTRVDHSLSDHDRVGTLHHCFSLANQGYQTLMNVLVNPGEAGYVDVSQDCHGTCTPVSEKTPRDWINRATG